MIKQIVATTIIFVLSGMYLFFDDLPFQKSNPQKAYQVYLNGDKLGIIASKEDLENYIDQEEIKLKEKYNVPKIYPPKGVEIKKITTYNEERLNSSEIYEKIKADNPFTIEAWSIKFKENGNNKVINVINKETFDKALKKVIGAFINIEEYEMYINETQSEIADTGSIIEEVKLLEKPTYKKTLLSTDDNIFVDESELTKYLLFGTVEEHEKYIIEEGDTIESVSEKHKLNPIEFLIANPEFTNVNNLLFPGKEVVIELIEPQVKIEVVKHVVSDKENDFKTDIRYDDSLVLGTSYEERPGEKGLVRVSEVIKYVNGEIYETANISKEELKPAVNRVIVRGGKVVRSVGDTSYWAWPTITPYRISSYFGWRWGIMHSGIDIAGVYHGSPILAANNGIIAKTGYNSSEGYHIYINHNNGYYTDYLHLSNIYVKEGQVVERGTVIGAMGNTGWSTGTHLHFGAWTGFPHRGGAVAFNPLTLYQ